MVFGAIVIALSVIIGVLVYLAHVYREEARSQEFSKKTKKRK